MTAVFIQDSGLSILDDSDLEAVSGGIVPVVVAFGAGFLKGVEIAAAGYALYLAGDYLMDKMTND